MRDCKPEKLNTAERSIPFVCLFPASLGADVNPVEPLVQGGALRDPRGDTAAEWSSSSSFPPGYKVPNAKGCA